MNLDLLRKELENPNVRAFLRALRLGEGTSDDKGYSRLVGGGEFEGFADHPRKLVNLGRIQSTAAGAYQFLSKTWDGLVRQYGFTNFSPANQDLGAVALIHGRKALDDVKNGRIREAVGKCNREWASLPGSPYGQRTETLAAFLHEYLKWGGQFIPQETPMLPAFAAAAIPALISAAPELVRVFSDKGKTVSERNQEAAMRVLEIAKEVTQAPNEQGAVEVIQSDPGKAAQFREQIHMSMNELLGMVKAIAEVDEASRSAARNFSIEQAKQPHNWPLWILTYGIVGGLGWMAYAKDLMTAELLTAIAMAVIGFHYGSSYGSMLKTQRGQ